MKKILLTALFLAVLIGCSVGPDYQRPDVTVPADYKEIKGWREARPQDQEIKSKWWEVFGDATLNDLIGQINVSNQTVALAEAQYRQSLAQLRQFQAGYFPSIEAGTSYQRYRTSSTSYVTTDVYAASMNASWELDIWGKVRRQVESGRASVEASFADLQAIKLSMQAQLAQSYFQLRALDEQIRNLDQTVLAYEKVLQLTQNRYNAGVAAKADVVQAQTQLQTTKAQAIDVGVQRAQLEHAIAVLIGKPPALFALPPVKFNWPETSIPVSLPSDLLERRPDIASAERKMAAANAKIGVAKAAYYPTLSLTGSLGYQSTELSRLFTSPHFFWALGPMALAATILDGGARMAKTDEARAAYDGAVANYRQTVLGAFQEVEDYLASLRILEQEARVQREAVLSAQESVQLTTNQYKAGIVSYLNVVTVQTTALYNERTAISLASQRLQASILLVKALGGGWSTDSPQKEAKK